MNDSDIQISALNGKRMPSRITPMTVTGAPLTRMERPTIDGSPP
jgi:hypothetical protein